MHTLYIYIILYIYNLSIYLTLYYYNIVYMMASNVEQMSLKCNACTDKVASPE